ncbi:hypothetical protein [Streptomyces sp. CdTB01]|uniref:hypothetical protein n=1 Tax=Streptomyces sp. CdTB01 TaxID=1725411 RepID=UPI00131F0550|nr:hypothetical protein [Streptomyces sp. CdTB01]
MGAIADVTAAVFFLVSSETRDWLRAHYMGLTVAGLLLVAATLALLNITTSQRTRISDLIAAQRELEAQLAEPSAHDADMFQAIMRRASPQSSLLVWLRDGFLVTHYEGSQLDSLDQFIDFCGRDPRGFDDTELNEMYGTLIEKCRNLRERIGPNIFPIPHTRRYSIPADWQDSCPEVYDAAVQTISAAHDELLGAYDTFIVTAQRKRFRSHLEAPDVHTIT